MKSATRWAMKGASRPKAHERIINFVMDNGSSGATAGMIAVLLGSTTSRARNRLDFLVERKTLVRRDDRYYLRMTKEADGG
jgi:hypothetical protein